MLQAPVPAEAASASRTELSSQIDWSLPASGAIGSSFTVIETVSVSTSQAPFEITQSNKFSPTESPETWSTGSEALLKMAVPEITCQVPVPIVGVSASSMVVVPQSAWSTPAEAGVGFSLRVMETSSNSSQLPFVTVHRKTTVPIAIPVNEEASSLGLPIVAVPLMMLH